MTDVTIPQIGESVSTVYVSRWLRKPGESVKAGEPVLEVDSDKASLEVPAPASGRLSEVLVEEGDEISVGAVVARIDEAATGEASPAPAPEAASPEAAAPEAAAPAPARPARDVKAGPAARVAAVEKGVDLGGVEGSGRGGRVTSADVAQAAVSGGVSHEAPVALRGPASPAEEGALVTRVRMSPLRRTVARRLVEAQQTAAMLTTFNEADMSEIMAVRKRYQERFVERYGIKLGFMSFFVKAAVDALKAFPVVNAEIEGDEILYKHEHHIGVAVSGPKGLVVPVLRSADRLSFAETEQGIADLAKRARDNKLGPRDFEGGTFTISNGGVFGSMMSTPILNPPQSGILGMHNIVERAVVRGGQIVARPMMYLALTYDHRLIDGREAVSFLVRLKECVENPERMLFEV